jgi:hypothetical protein
LRLRIFPFLRKRSRTGNPARRPRRTASRSTSRSKAAPRWLAGIDQPADVLAVAFNYRGYSYHGKAEFACEIQGYSRAIKLMPDYADAYSNRGAD